MRYAPTNSDGERRRNCSPKTRRSGLPLNFAKLPELVRPTEIRASSDVCYCEQTFLGRTDVRFWHKADMLIELMSGALFQRAYPHEPTLSCSHKETASFYGLKDF
jgi:hypothetical protein